MGGFNIFTVFNFIPTLLILPMLFLLVIIFLFKFTGSDDGDSKNEPYGVKKFRGFILLFSAIFLVLFGGFAFHEDLSRFDKKGSYEYELSQALSQCNREYNGNIMALRGDIDACYVNIAKSMQRDVPKENKPYYFDTTGSRYLTFKKDMLIASEGSSHNLLMVKASSKPNANLYRIDGDSSGKLYAVSVVNTSSENASSEIKIYEINTEKYEQIYDTVSALAFVSLIEIFGMIGVFLFLMNMTHISVVQEKTSKS